MEMQALEIEQPKVQMYPDGRMDPENAVRHLEVSPTTLAMWRCAGTGPPFVYVGGKVFGSLGIAVKTKLGSIPIPMSSTT